MNLKILSFAGKTIEIDNAISLTIDTKMGQITVLNSHSPLITALKPCVAYIKYFDENNMPKREDFAIGGGILEVAWTNVKVLADMLMDIDEVNADKASDAIKKAEELMAKYKDSTDKIDMEKFVEAEEMLMKSIAQLKLSELK